MSRAAGRRGLIAVAFVVLLLLAIADFLRRDSFLKSLFHITPASRQEQVIEGVRRRISRTDGPGLGLVRDALPETGKLPG